MLNNFNTVKGTAMTEIVIKKSRFLAFSFHVENVDEAEALLKSVQKEHHKATHNTYAYILDPDGNTFKYSDDGEPSLTAGKPIYDCMKGLGMSNTLVVVTRYFGGTKLGTGGLVRAYAQSAKSVLDASTIVRMELHTCCRIISDYSMIGTLQNYFSTFDLVVNNMDFTDNVLFDVSVNKDQVDRFVKGYVELSNGGDISCVGDIFVEKS
ncbi:YigZ family protein [Alkalibacter mobilis]|uniref:YigZ family protein n=1 Tax=Alkalibacter mobilis TaxID=2787712 RepID=UPI0018A07BB0|nr:YigZ family protein [Alkalibacter mobilis]MBF7095898.1 YigZ family protein [Alkalibacter mobilis]